nr:T-complex protein 1 subunit beta [Tanacetum cinerariifolium]
HRFITSPPSSSPPKPSSPRHHLLPTTAATPATSNAPPPSPPSHQKGCFWFDSSQKGVSHPSSSWIPLITSSLWRLKDFLKMKLPKRRVNMKTILGPKGIDKILQSTGGGHSVRVTNVGATILKSLHIDNPTAKVFI